MFEFKKIVQQLCEARDHRVFQVGSKPHITAFQKAAVCRCSTKVGKVHRETPVPEFLFNKIKYKKKFTFFKKIKKYVKKETSAQVSTCEFWKAFQKTYFLRKFAWSCFWKCFFKNTSERLLLNFRGFNFYALKKF